MHRDMQMSQLENWSAVCAVDEIVPDTGVCALLNGRQVAVFRIALVDDDERLFAIDNYDPNAHAAVLSRGLVGSLGERIVVASPIYKHHFDLQTGECLEVPAHSVRSFPVRVENGTVWVAS
jgi:nitrite reductase (NADH) small subunit